MTHTFVVNTESVNEYGYRVLTDGIDFSQYMSNNPIVLYGHKRAFDDPEKVVGRCLRLYVEDKKLLAEIEIDENDKFSKKLAQKIADGYIRMASLFADVIETSTEPELILPGQTLETVTKSKLIEISIVDIGGNAEAIKLSRNGKPIQLNKLESKKKIDMSLKNIALCLALAETASEGDILSEVNVLKASKQDADQKVIELQGQIKEIQTTEATALVEKAVSLGLIPEGLKAVQLTAFEADFKGQKQTFVKLIADKEAENDTDNTHNKVKEVVLGAKGGSPEKVALTFDYLQKHDKEELRRIREEEPEQYAALARAFADGVRHKD